MLRFFVLLLILAGLVYLGNKSTLRTLMDTRGI